MRRRLLWMVGPLVLAVLWLTPAMAGPGAPQAVSHGIQEFQGPGAHVWIAPPRVTSVTVELWGAAGGGSRGASATQSGNGGGAGAYVRRVISVVPGASYVVMIGAGGVGGGPGFGSPGTAGEDSSVQTIGGVVLTFAGGGGGGDDVTGPGPGGMPDPAAGLSRPGNGGQDGSGYPGGAGGAAILGTVGLPYGMAGGAGGPARGGSFVGRDGGSGYAILSW